MKLEIKNFKYMPSLSEETNAFTGDLFVNGTKVAFCKNSGHGGESQMDTYEGKRDLFKKADTYADSLPAVPSDWDESLLPMNLEFWVSLEVERLIQLKEDKKYFNKGLCITKDKTSNEFQIVAWGKHTIPKMLKSEKGVEVIKKGIIDYEAKGYHILNTNIPFHKTK